MAKKTKVYIGADHAGFALKEHIKKFLQQRKISLWDCGNTGFDPDDDYPDYAYAVAKEVAAHNVFGILVCGSAEGMSIAANKVKGVRAVVVHDVREARLTRKHNNANVLCLSGWRLPVANAQRIISIWLATPFSAEERHRRRINKIRKIERQEL
ncbi:RpiB/LacA/LacB family sugar-phosphate isomerase [Candidatus Woesearchaeota archaeon]|nr:RpiB/LacA/LacB family sugar-phosphate isomerase [Candidatus Woesearchaeota archaeon]